MNMNHFLEIGIATIVIPIIIILLTAFSEWLSSKIRCGQRKKKIKEMIKWKKNIRK